MLTHTYPQFSDLLRARYSCRSFANTPVDDEQIAAVLEAARLAPSACNRQPWTFVVVRDDNARREMLKASRPAFLEAPVVIVACGHHDEAWHRAADNKDHTDIDLAIAVEHICLAATTLGLGTCWVCSFDTVATRQTLGIPDDVEPVALIPMGYPAGDNPVPMKIRKSIEQIIRWEKY